MVYYNPFYVQPTTVWLDEHTLDLRKMKTAVYTGSFDPVTLGHLNVIERSAKLVDRLVIGIGVNIEKTGLFLPEERIDLVQRLSLIHI